MLKWVSDSHTPPTVMAPTKNWYWFPFIFLVHEVQRGFGVDTRGKDFLNSQKKVSTRCQASITFDRSITVSCSA